MADVSFFPDVLKAQNVTQQWRTVYFVLSNMLLKHACLI
jgi:hypothetical protein